MRGLRWWTGTVVMFAAMFVLAWDIFAFSVGGMDATISSVITGYLGMDGNPMAPFGVGFVCGGLWCHFCGWTMARPKHDV